MAYLLVLPICLYIVLATVVLLRGWRSSSNALLAAYLLNIAAITFADLVLGTTSHKPTAVIAAVTLLIAAGWAYAALLPLALASLYLPIWFYQHRQRLLTIALTILPVSEILLLMHLEGLDRSLVYPVKTGYWPVWSLTEALYDTTETVLILILSQSFLIAVVGLCLYRQRMSLWRDALPLTMASVLSTMIILMSPLAGQEWRMTISGLGFLPLIGVVLLRVIFPADTRLWLERSADSRHKSRDALILINTDQHVIWHNAAASQWLHYPGQKTTPKSSLLDRINNKLLSDTVQRALLTGSAATQQILDPSGQDRLIGVECQPLPTMYQQPGTQLVCIQDLTLSPAFHNLRERSKELLVLSAISADITSSLDVDQVIARALQQVLAVTSSEDAVVYLTDDSLPVHLKLAGRRSSLPPFRPAPVTVPIKDTVLGDVVQTRQPIIISNAAQDSVYGPYLIEQDVQSLATVPLITRDRLIGALQVASSHPHDYDMLETALLESVGRQLAVAIDNARLHHQERQQRRVAETLHKVAHIFSTSHQDEALQAMLRQLYTVIEYDRATMMLHAEPGYLSIQAYAGFTPDPDEDVRHIRVAISEYPYLQQLFEQSEPQLISDTTQNPNWKPSIGTIGSWIGAPLVVRDQVLGCLSLTHTQPGRFTPDDLHVVKSFIDQAAVAVENIRLFESEQRRRTDAETLQQASYDVVTSPDLDTALTSVLTHLSHLLEFDRAHIGLIDTERKHWILRAELGYTAEEMPQLHTPVTLDKYPLVQRILQNKRPIMVEDTTRHKLWRPARYSPKQVQSWIGAPLIARDQVIGIINIDSYRPHSFTESMFQIVQLFANQLGAAVENFHLLEEADRQNQTLRVLNTILAAGNEALTNENLLIVTLERMLDTLGLCAGAIHQRDLSSNELMLRAVSGMPPSVIGQISRLAGTVKTVTPIWPDGADRPTFSVPLMSHGTNIGILSVCNQPGQSFSAESKQLLINIGQQLGIVMHNAALFEETARREILSTNLGRFGLAISAQLDRKTVLDLICRESAGAFDAQSAYLWLVEGDKLVGTACYCQDGGQFAGHSQPLSDTERLPANVLHRGRPRYLNRAMRTNLLPPDLLVLTRAKAVIAVPMFNANIPIGVLMLVNTENPTAFASWQTEQIGLLGVQAALTIQNANLFDEIRRRLDQLRLVNEVSRYATAILSSSQNLIEGVAHKLFDYLNFNIIGLLEVDQGELIAISFLQDGKPIKHERAHHYFLQPDSIAYRAVRQAQPMLDSGANCNILHPTNDTGGCCSLAVPLIIADEVIGTLIVGRQGQNTLTQQDVDVLEPLAAQLAIAVQNARLFEKVRQQTVELEARVSRRTAEIRQQQERTEAILRSVADAVIVFDLSGQIMMANPVAQGLFDHHDHAMRLSERIGSLVAKTLSSQSETTQLTEIIELDTITLQAKVARVVEGDQMLGSVAVLRDISRFKELDRMKDGFVSNVSHELRTPLANLKLYVSLLEKGRAERRTTYIEVMNREVRRLERLISELLDLSRLQSEQRDDRPQVRQVVDVDNLIATVIENHIARAESEHDELIHEKSAENMLTIMADPDQIVRALTNLVSNSINYTPQGGRIVIRSRAETHGHPESEWVIIEVSDNGIGIPSEEVSLIFDRFYRGTNVDPNVPGTGLGLAIIKEIVDLHGGTLSVESTLGEGSTFCIMLPALNSKHSALNGGHE